MENELKDATDFVERLWHDVLTAAEIKKIAEGIVKDSYMKTSKEWYHTPWNWGRVIIDPLGWDKENYDWSFNHELITNEEFEKRFADSETIDLDE